MIATTRWIVNKDEDHDSKYAKLLPKVGEMRLPTPGFIEEKGGA
jgi:hypothetical protein